MSQRYRIFTISSMIFCKCCDPICDLVFRSWPGAHAFCMSDLWGRHLVWLDAAYFGLFWGCPWYPWAMNPVFERRYQFGRLQFEFASLVFCCWCHSEGSSCQGMSHERICTKTAFGEPLPLEDFPDVFLSQFQSSSTSPTHTYMDPEYGLEDNVIVRFARVKRKPS